jgi:hypothetical protein
MDSEINDADRLLRAVELSKIVQGILISKKFEADADVSIPVMFDVIYRWERDTKRIEQMHDRGVHPVKFIAYQAFWIRKLKPISGAYKRKHLDSALEMGKEEARQFLLTKEIKDINERVAIQVAAKQLLTYARENVFPAPYQGNVVGVNSLDPTHLREYIADYMNFPSSGDRYAGGPSDRKTDEANYRNLIYNQRYRTFGPHHLTHVFETILFGAWKLQNLSTS